MEWNGIDITTYDGMNGNPNHIKTKQNSKQRKEI